MEIEKTNKIDEELSKELLKDKENIVRLKEDIERINQEKQRYREMGQLNEDDVNKLKD